MNLILTSAARLFAVLLLSKMEAFVLIAYQDSGGTWTIGCGSTFMPNGRRVARGDRITTAQAAALLGKQVETWFAIIQRLVNVPLSDNWTAVLISFIHQEGPNALPGSVLLDMINAQLWDRAGRQLNGWVVGRVNGVEQPILGIERRQEAQREMTTGLPVEPTRTNVWMQGDAALRPLYVAACDDAKAYRNGVVSWKVVPVTLATHPSVSSSARGLPAHLVGTVAVQLTADDLNQMSLDGSYTTGAPA
jgi:GH24 family phage-related lysozyme (muramidase)